MENDGGTEVTLLGIMAEGALVWFTPTVYISCFLKVSREVKFTVVAPMITGNATKWM